MIRVSASTNSRRVWEVANRLNDRSEGLRSALARPVRFEPKPVDGFRRMNDGIDYAFRRLSLAGPRHLEAGAGSTLDHVLSLAALRPGSVVVIR